MPSMHAATVCMSSADSILSMEAAAPDASHGVDQALLHLLTN